MNVKPVDVFCVVIVVIFICSALWIAVDWLTSTGPELHIPATGCLFRIESNETPAFFVEVFVNNRLKIIIDDEVYWIRLEAD